MARMLASVTGPDEAILALQAGADLIDLKDPQDGALGAVPLSVVRHTIATIAGRRPVSAVAGNLPMQPDAVLAAATALADTGIDYLKLGIFPGGDPAACIRAVAPLAARVKLVAVLFADTQPDLALLPLLAEAGFAGAMLDTHDKRAGRLLQHMDLPALRDFMAACQRHGLFPRRQPLLAGLAGGLEAPDVPRLLVLGPDILGFRTALCGTQGRAGALDAAATTAIRALIPPDGADPATQRVDYRLLAARGYAPDPNGDPAQHDRVFVHDFVLPVRIGTYAFEHDKPQPVRFHVDAIVARPARPTQDMRDVFSYDIISDGIRLLVDAGHVGLVETLAERIAMMLLAHPRVVKVSVRLEKLETGSGIVGVAIERTRGAPAAPMGQMRAREAEGTAPA